MTLLAFARLRDDSKLSRAELELKQKNLKTMNLDETLRQKALAKIEEQIAELPDDDQTTGVPDDFIEESKAVTDGHVVLEDLGPLGGGTAEQRWCVDLQESVARGITSDSVQCRPLHILRSLNLKVYLMQREDGGDVMEREGDGYQMDSAPLLSLMRQPLGDVLSVADEAALFMLAMDAAKRCMDARPLADEAIACLRRSRVRFDDDDVTQRLVLGTRRWAEGVPGKPAPVLTDVGDEAITAWLDRLELKPLERKRVLATLAGESNAEEPAAPLPAVKEDLIAWYETLRARLGFVQEAFPDLLSAIAEPGLSDPALELRLATLHSRICRG